MGFLFAFRPPVIIFYQPIYFIGYIMHYRAVSIIARAQR